MDRVRRRRGRSLIAFACTIVLPLSFGACVESKRNILDSDQSQLAMRQIQSRAFDTKEIKKTQRTVIATMQDLGFVIDKADEDLGTVSGTKLDGYQLRMTVTVRPRGTRQVMVRANAQYNLYAVNDAEIYQQFFVSLEKAMFLTAQQVD